MPSRRPCELARGLMWNGKRLGAVRENLATHGWARRTPKHPLTEVETLLFDYADTLRGLEREEGDRAPFGVGLPRGGVGTALTPARRERILVAITQKDWRYQWRSKRPVSRD